MKMAKIKKECEECKRKFNNLKFTKDGRFVCHSCYTRINKKELVW